MTKLYKLFFIYGILFLGAAFRFLYLTWDNNYHMHPDERAIILAVLNLTYTHSLEEFFSPQSSWNPHFFAYGSFPFYLLKILSAFHASFATYDGLSIMGRYLSSLFDIGTIILLYFVGKKVGNEIVGLLSSFFYSIAVLPIQLSHFYAVDTPLAFFTLAILYLLLIFYEKPSGLKAVLIGLTFAFALATKISSVVLLFSFIVVFSIDFLLIFIRAPHKIKQWSLHLPHFFKNFILYGVTILTVTFFFLFIFEPYAFIDFSEFWKQTLQQQAMTKDAFTFPYTLQYVGKIPYLYELKNVFLFGLGPLLSIICFAGVIWMTTKTFFQDKSKKWAMVLLLITFFWCYFFIVGSFAIGFMRYMLPLYPLFCLFGGILIYTLVSKVKNQTLQVVCCLLLIVSSLIWPLSFMQMYTRPNTRIQATNWITSNIPSGSSIALEHWDDALPIVGQENYTMLTLPLYDPDTPEKWAGITNTLQQTDYIILASNRLSVPLQKLTDCSRLPQGRCYPQTAQYYKALFSETLGFESVAEFTSFPTIPFFNIPIDDQTADESFTVYDHPKIMIFRRATDKLDFSNTRSSM